VWMEDRCFDIRIPYNLYLSNEKRCDAKRGFRDPVSAEEALSAPWR
jgi:hypothetical protein